MVRAVLFDLDDTLIDSAPAFAHGCRYALGRLEERNPSIPLEVAEREWWGLLRETVAALPSDGSMQALRRERFPLLLQRLGIEDDLLAVELDRCLGEEQLRALRPFDDVSALEQLLDRYRLGVVTNGAADDHWDSQPSKARYCGVHDLFECFLVSDEERARKPDPTMFLRAASRLGVPSGECAFVGDSLLNDVAGANGAGMVSILLHRVGKASSSAGEPRPDHTVRSLHELPGLLAGL